MSQDPLKPLGPGVPGLLTPEEQIRWMPGVGATAIPEQLAGRVDDLPDGPQAWSEHLRYDLMMMRRCIDLSTHFEARGTGLESEIELHVALFNTINESFLVHVRNVTEFFRGTSAKSDYFHVSKFLKLLNVTVKAWRVSVGVGEQDMAQINKMYTHCCTHLSHASVGRTNDFTRRRVNLEEYLSALDSMTTKLVTYPGVAALLSPRRDWSRWGGSAKTQ